VQNHNIIFETHQNLKTQKFTHITKSAMSAKAYSQNFPNVCIRRSFLVVNWLTTDGKSRRSRYSWFTFQSATLFNLSCVIVLLSQVFKRRRLLNDRSASQDVIGMTGISLNNTSTCENNCRTSGV